MSALTVQARTGLREIFRDFRLLELDVGPFHGSPYALRSVLGAYLEHFRPRRQLEREFRELLHRVLWHPLESHDRALGAGDRFRVAAGAHFLGVKPWSDGDALSPARSLIEALPAEARRFANPLNLGVPENIMLWARSADGQEHLAVRRLFDAVTPFDKCGRQPAPTRDALMRLEPVLMTEPHPLPDTAVKATRLYFSRRWRDRMAEGWERDGVRGVGGVWQEMGPRLWHQLLARTRLTAGLRADRGAQSDDAD